MEINPNIYFSRKINLVKKKGDINMKGKFTSLVNTLIHNLLLRWGGNIKRKKLKSCFHINLIRFLKLDELVTNFYSKIGRCTILFWQYREDNGYNLMTTDLSILMSTFDFIKIIIINNSKKKLFTALIYKFCSHLIYTVALIKWSHAFWL